MRIEGRKKGGRKKGGKCDYLLITILKKYMKFILFVSTTFKKQINSK